MRNALLATASLAFVSSPALAADKMSVGVSGYMQQWFGMADLDTKDSKNDGGFAQQSDSEFFITGKLESDSGLTFGVKIEVEGNGSGGIDESVASIGGSFGKINIGAEDNAQTLTHVGVQDVGVGLNCGDVGAWIDGVAGCGNGLETTGHQHGDKKGLTYFTPRMSGVQLAASYIPNANSEAANDAVHNNDDNAWAVGLNAVQSLGEASVKFSVGHYNRANGGMTEHMTYNGATTGADEGLTRGMFTNLTSDYALWVNQPTDAGAPTLPARDINSNGNTEQAGEGAVTNLDTLRARANAAKAALAAVPSTTTMKGMDDRTFTNAGLQVGMGAFGFSVGYATAELPATYSVMNDDKVVVVATNRWDHDGDGCAAQDVNDCTGITDPTAGVLETNDQNDPSNDLVRSKIVEDPSHDYDVASVGVMYSDGPVAVSLAYMGVDRDNGDDTEATMLSMSYTLAPGVASRTSIFAADQGDAEGTAFVTGITLSF